MRTLSFLAAVLFAGVAAANPTVDYQFAKLRDAQVNAYQAAGDAADKAADNAAASAESGAVSVQTPSVSRGTSLTAIQKLNAFISGDTDKDVEAGATINPFALANSTYARGLSVSLASLKETASNISSTAAPKGARIGIGFASAVNADGIKSAVQAKKIAAFAPAAVKANLNAQLAAFQQACVAVAAAQAAPPAIATPELLEEAIVTCTGSGAGPTARTLLEAFANFNVLLPQIAAVGGIALLLNAAVAAATPLVTAAFLALSAADVTYLQPTDAAIAQEVASQDSHKIGFGLHVDAFPLVWGFQAPLPVGWVTQALVGEFEYSSTTQRYEWAFDVAVGGAKNAPKDGGFLPLLTLTPSGTVAVVLVAFNSKTGGTINLEKEILPSDAPKISLGFDAKVNLVPNQTNSFQAISLEPHLDVVVSSNLSVRIGIPFDGTFVSQTDSSTRMNSSGLQWSLPASIATVLKM